jgi:hypothetical protein
VTSRRDIAGGVLRGLRCDVMVCVVAFSAASGAALWSVASITPHSLRCRPRPARASGWRDRADLTDVGHIGDLVHKGGRNARVG